MLIRQLQKPGDYERAVLTQEENLKLAIANDENIAAARRNMSEGVIPEPTEQQKRSLAETLAASTDTKLEALNHLRSIFSESQVQKFMGSVQTDEFYDFINIYWEDIKQELKTKDVKRMTIPYFRNVLQSVMKWNVGQAGLSTAQGLAYENDSLNEVSELKRVVPDPEIFNDIGARLGELGQEAIGKEYVILSQILPNNYIYKKLQDASPAIRQQVVSQLMTVMRPLNPTSTFWNAVLNANPNNVFINVADTEFPYLDLEGMIRAYELIDPKFALSVREGIRKTREEEMGPRGPPRKKEIQSPEPLLLTPERRRVTIIGRPPAPVSRPESAPRPVSVTPVKKRAKSVGRRSFRGDVYIPPGTNVDTGLTREEPVPQTEMDKLIANPRSSRTVLSFFKKGRVKSGKGIALQPRLFHDFGKYLIDGTELDKQILSVKYQSGAPIPNFGRKTAISDTFQELLKDLIESQKLNKSLMKELEPTERVALETLLIKSGIGVGLGIKEITPTDEDKEKMKRLEVLQGSFNAGNNSRELIHELRSLVIYFMNTGRINKREALETLQTLV